MAKTHGLSTSILGSAKEVGFSINVIIDDNMAANTIEYDNRRRRIRRKIRKDRKAKNIFDKESKILRLEAYIKKCKKDHGFIYEQSLQTLESKDATINAIKESLANAEDLIYKKDSRIVTLTNKINDINIELSKSKRANSQVIYSKDNNIRYLGGKISLLESLNKEYKILISFKENKIEVLEKQIKARLKLKWWQLIFND